MALKKVAFNKQWYERLVSRTDEKEKLLGRIRELVSRGGFRSCLEIGLGTEPYFAEGLSNLFGRYVIVEKEEPGRDLPEGVAFVRGDWEKLDISEKFDIIIASHVVYYFGDMEKAVRKMLGCLTENGVLLIAVNGKDADYGPLKREFSRILGIDYAFTYDKLLSLLDGSPHIEYTIPSSIRFGSHEELFETLRISFDAYPDEYSKMKGDIVSYLKKAMGNRSSFIVNQKLLLVKKARKQGREWVKLVRRGSHELEIKGMRILVREGVFIPDPGITNSSLMMLDNFPDVSGKAVLDMGCGTGIIGIYAALRGARDVLAVDNDESCLENTRMNAELNGVEGRIGVQRSDLFGDVPGRFDFIFANLPIQVEVWDPKVPNGSIIPRFLGQCRAHARKGGTVYFTHASFADTDSIRKLCSRMGFSFKEVSESRLGFRWHLFELSF